jgi:hypothetical protein
MGCEEASLVSVHLLVSETMQSDPPVEDSERPGLYCEVSREGERERERYTSSQ